MMRRSVVSLALVAVLSPVSWAAGGGGPVEIPVLEIGDADDGSQLVATCIACHGQVGVSPDPAFPSLAGQRFDYLLSELRRIQSGKRPAPLMIGQLDAMSDENLHDIAAFYAAQSSPQRAVAKDLLEAGRTLWMSGDATRAIPACTACHGPSGRGLAHGRIPALQGQHAAYTEKALRDYASGKRPVGAGGNAMLDIAARLTDEDVAAVASFAAGLRD